MKYAKKSTLSLILGALCCLSCNPTEFVEKKTSDLTSKQTESALEVADNPANIIGTYLTCAITDIDLSNLSRGEVTCGLKQEGLSTDLIIASTFSSWSWSKEDGQGLTSNLLTEKQNGDAILTFTGPSATATVSGIASTIVKFQGEYNGETIALQKTLDDIFSGIQEQPSPMSPPEPVAPIALTCDGYEADGYCYFQSATDQDCNQTCQANGLDYNQAGTTYMNERSRCEAALHHFGALGNIESGTSIILCEQCGCSECVFPMNGIRGLWTSPEAPTAEAQSGLNTTNKRVCACD